MKIQFYDIDFWRGNAFFQYLYRSLKGFGASGTEKKPPSKRIIKPREHTGAWIRINYRNVFVDMSDHIFSYDTKALKRANIYFKANYNRKVTRRVLEEKNLQDCKGKIKPFIFLPPSLRFCRNLQKIYRLKPKNRICYIVGVYENRTTGSDKNALSQDENISPSRYHFWIRYHLSNAFKKNCIPGYYRITSRGNRKIVDDFNIKQNLHPAIFMYRIIENKITVVNTLPHAVMPWKSIESLALGRPFIVEREPLIEIPKSFEIKKGKHFLEIFPGLGSFDETASLEDPRSYRILEKLSNDKIEAAVKEIGNKLLDNELMKYMRYEAIKYSNEKLSAKNIINYLLKEAEV